MYVKDTISQHLLRMDLALGGRNVRFRQIGHSMFFVRSLVKVHKVIHCYWRATMSGLRIRRKAIRDVHGSKIVQDLFIDTMSLTANKCLIRCRIVARTGLDQELVRCRSGVIEHDRSPGDSCLGRADRADRR